MPGYYRSDYLSVTVLALLAEIFSFGYLILFAIANLEFL